jgi:hypothetical protein
MSFKNLEEEREFAAEFSKLRKATLNIMSVSLSLLSHASYTLARTGWIFIKFEI